MARKIFSLLVIALFAYVVSPLLIPVAMGAVFAVLFFPWLERLEEQGLKTSPASALLTILVTLVFLIPAAILIFLGAKAGLQQVRVWRETPRTPEGSFFESAIHSPTVERVVDALSQWIPISAKDFSDAAQDLARTVGFKLADILGGFLGYLPTLTMGLAIMVMSIFFFLVDGRKVVMFVRRNSVFGQQQTENLIHAFAGMCRSVILATVISGVVQSLIYSISCLSVGVPNVALIGFVVFLASFVPLVGSAPVTFGVAINQLLIGNKTAGIVLLIMAGVVALIDNLIRPMVLKGSGNLHPLLAFVAAFGGIKMLGIAGVFLGPIIAGLFMVTVENLVDRSG